MDIEYVNVGNGVEVGVPKSQVAHFTGRMAQETQGMDFDGIMRWMREQHYNYPTKIKRIPMTDNEINIIRFGDAEGRYADPGYVARADGKG